MDVLLAQRQMSYEHLWTLFPPGSYAYAYDDETDQGFISLVKEFRYVDSTALEEGYFVIECDIIVYDNLSFGRSKTELRIPEFSAIRAIIDLSAYPVEYREDYEKLWQDALSRGKRYADMSLHFCRHEGSATIHDLRRDWDPTRKLKLAVSAVLRCGTHRLSDITIRSMSALWLTQNPILNTHLQGVALAPRPKCTTV